MGERLFYTYHMAAVLFRLLSIFLMIGIGWIARRRTLLNADTTRNLSRLLTSRFYPALIFTSISHNFNTHSLLSNWQLPAGTFLIMLTGFLIGLLVERFLTDPHSKQGHAFLFQCTINNFSFLPMPLALMLWGEAGVAGLIFSAMGPELAMWTLGVYALSGRRLRRENLQRLLNPPLLTLTATLCFVLLRDALPEGSIAVLSHPVLAELQNAVQSTLKMLGAATIPIAMMIAGSRMAGLKAQHLFSKVQMVLALLRLIIIPAAAIGLIFLLPLEADVRRILVLVAIMPVAVSSVVLCELYDGDSDFSASAVLVTHLFCLITVPIWLALLSI